MLEMTTNEIREDARAAGRAMRGTDGFVLILVLSFALSAMVILGWAWRHERHKVDLADFAEFERLMIGATHTAHRLDADQYRRVRERFALNMGADGANFRSPMRVDILRRP